MLAAEGHQVGDPGHGAVVFHDFADDAAGVQACQTRQVHAGLGLARAGQDAPGAGPEGKHMAGLDEVLGPGFRGDEGLNGAGTILGADARGGAFPGFDGHAEGGLEGAGVVPHHEGDLQAVQQGALQGGADQAPAVGGHEGNGLGRHMLGGQGEVALVLPVLVIHHHHHPALPDGVDGVFNGCERRGRKLVHGTPSIAQEPAGGKGALRGKVLRSPLHSFGRFHVPGRHPRLHARGTPGGYHPAGGP